MYRLGLAFVALLLAAPAWGQTTRGGATSAAPVIAAGGSTPISLANRAAFIFNVKDGYGGIPGAVGDDTTDDTAAINATFAAARASIIGGDKLAQVVFPIGKYKTTGDINATGFVSTAFGVQIIGQGAEIDCQDTGIAPNLGVCLDLLGDRYVTIRDLSIVGNGSSTPVIGIQIGRISAASADEIQLDNVFIQGNFTEADFYNFASESSQFTHSRFWNNANNGYCVIMDGINHFAAASQFVTQTNPANTFQSFIQDIFIDGDFRELGTGGAPLWMSAAKQHSYINTYLAATAGTTAIATVLYSLAGTTPAYFDLLFDVHTETAAVAYDFLITGTNTTPVLSGLRYTNVTSPASLSIFKADTGITTVTLRNTHLDIGFFAVASATVLDQPSIYTWDGSFTTPLVANWVPPANGSLTLLIGDKLTNGAYGTSGVATMSAQYPDAATAGGNTRGANAVDWQSTRSASNQVASGANSVIGGGNANLASGQYSSVLGGNSNVAIGVGSATLGGAGNFPQGAYSTAAGLNSGDRARQTTHCVSSGEIAAQSDSQTCFMTFRGTTSNTSTVQLAGGTAGTVGAQSIMNIPVNTAYTVTVELVAIDHTTPANTFSWVLPNGLLTRGAGNAAWTAGTPVTLSTGAVTGLSVAASADATNEGLNITFTPPTSNTDKWNVTARVTTVEAQ